jgi:ABC-type transport system involved in cytochrome c biogenesis permease subunit
MEKIEGITFWITVFVYMASFLLHLHAFTRQSERGICRAMTLLWVGLGMNTLLLALHWIVTGHPPVVDSYELQLSAAWCTVLLFLLFQKAGMVERVLALMIAPITFLLLGNAYASQAPATSMGPLYATPWMFVHVTFAWIAFGSYALAAAAGILLLFYTSIDRKFPNRLPSVEDLDRSSYRFIVLGVVNQVIMLASGAIWAKRAWGEYWSWSPLEAWSLLSFLLYVFYLHARRFLGWNMKRTAWIAAFGLVMLSISYWGVKWLAPSRHPGP